MRPRGLTLGEAAVGGAFLLLAGVAWAALGLATLERHSVLGVAVLGGAIAVVLVAAFRRMAVRVDRAEVACLAALALVALVLYLPGWPRTFGDLDPGVYLAHGAHIARTGSLAIDDPVVDPALDLPWADVMGRPRGGTRFPGYYVQARHPRRVVPQFYALYPALLGTAGRAFGRDAMPDVNPLLATFAVLLVFLVVQRTVGRVAGLVAAGLLATNVVETYYARCPGSEMLAQALVLAALLGAAVAARERSTAAAILGGVCASLAFLARPEGVVAVILGALGAGAALAMCRSMKLPAAFGTGLLLPLPHAFVQAYHPDLCALYSRHNGLPGPWAVGLVAIVLIGAGALLRLARRHGLATTRWGQAPMPWIAAMAVTLAVGIGMGGPLFLEPFRNAHGRPLYTELGTWRLALLLSPPAFALAWVGLLRACFGRWRPRRLLPLLPLAFLPLVLVQPQLANTYLLPWSRRLVVFVLPACFALVGGAAALAFSRGGRGARLAAGAGLAAAVLASLGLSGPLFSHVEGRGSREVVDLLGRLGGSPRALLLFSPGPENPAARALGGPVWSWHRQTTAVLPRPLAASDVQRFQSAFPDQPAFLVTGSIPPASLCPVVRGLETAFVARVPRFGLSRNAALLVDESFPVLVYRLGPALPEAPAACYGRLPSQEVPSR